jgi:threonine dehydratase
MLTPLVPDLDHLRRAYAATSELTQETPLLRSPAFAEAVGAREAFVKAESLQWTGSFKARGALWRLLCLSVGERRRGVVAYSSGNFAQGLAATGARLGVPVTIVMPIDAPPAKREATLAYGARVVVTDHGERAREEVAAERARAISEDEGLVLLHPFDDPEIVAGQAGVGLEAIAQLEKRGAAADALFCGVGGGGLIGGVSLAFHYLSPRTQLFAVEPERFDGMGRSLAAGEAATVPLTAPPSICDGMMARRPGAAPLAAASRTNLMGVTVSDAAVRRAMRFAFEKLKLVLEPSGAAPLAAALDGGMELSGKTVLAVATGGNVSLADFLRHVGDA